MVYFLYGKDSFRVLEFVKKVLKGKKYKKIFFEDFSFKDLISLVSSDSLFEGLLEAEHFFIRGEKLTEALEIPSPIIKDKNKKIIFYFEEVNASALKKIAEAESKEIKIKKFEPLQGISLKKFIESYLTHLEVKFDRMAVDILSDFCKGDLWKMATEVSRLLVQNSTSFISFEDLQHLKGYSLKQNAFIMIDAAIGNQKSKSFQILNDLIQRDKIDEFKIVGAINWQLKNLILVKDLALKKYNFSLIEKVFGMRYFTFKKILQQSFRFSPETLKKIHSELVRLHLKLRRSKVSRQVLIERFIYSLGG